MSELPARRRLREKQEREAVLSGLAGDRGGDVGFARGETEAEATDGTHDTSGRVSERDSRDGASPSSKDAESWDDGGVGVRGGAGEAAYEGPTEADFEDGVEADENDADAAAPNESWRAFDSDTEAGRLLRQLYGGRAKPVINYPKVRTKKRAPAGAFIPGGGKVESDARKPKASNKKVAVPKRAPSYEPVAPIHFAPRRKAAAEIEAELRKVDEEKQRYRPVPRRAISTEREKARVQNVFQFKGGKALPESGMSMPIEGQLPLSMLTGKPVKARRGGAAASSTSRTIPAPAEVLELQELFDKVMGEIVERKDFVADMEKAGAADPALRNRVKREIAVRVTELERIDGLIKAEMESRPRGVR